MADEIKVEETTEQTPAEETQNASEEANEDIDLKAQVEKLETQLEQAEYAAKQMRLAKKKKAEVDDDFLEEDAEARNERLRQLAKEEAEAVLAQVSESLIKKHSEEIGSMRNKLNELKKSLSSKMTKSTAISSSGQKQKEEPKAEYDPQIVSMMSKSGLIPDGLGGWKKAGK